MKIDKEKRARDNIAHHQSKCLNDAGNHHPKELNKGYRAKETHHS